MEAADAPEVPDVVVDPRNQPVQVFELDRTYPPACEYDGLDPRADDRFSLKTWSRAPWLDYEAVVAGGDHFMRYVDAQGFLPGQLHVDCLTRWSWRRQYCVRDQDLLRRGEQLPSTLREEFARLALKGMFHLLCVDPIPAALDVDAFVYRTRADAPFVEALLALPDATLDGWRDVVGVRQTAVLCPQPLLRMEFRFRTKRSNYWRSWIPEERYARSRWGLAVPYQCPQAQCLSRKYRRANFIQLTAGWQRYEVAQGCCVELLPIFSYKGGALISHHFGHWVVSYTEVVCRTADFVIQDVY